MIPLYNIQGSTEWICDRLWRLTASNAKSNITSKFTLSKSEAAYKSIDKLIAGLKLANEIRTNEDRLIPCGRDKEGNEVSRTIVSMSDYELQNFMATYTGDKFKGSAHTLRGNDLEADALASLSEKIGEDIGDVGMFIMGELLNGVVSASPDGEIFAGSKRIAGVEVKSPSYCTFIKHVTDNILPKDYDLQVNMGMAVGDLDTWHYASYFEGEPLFYKKVQRTNDTDKLQQSLIDFADMYAERHAEVEAAMTLLASYEKEMVA